MPAVAALGPIFAGLHPHHAARPVHAEGTNRSLQRRPLWSCRAAGELRPGDKLPPERELAEQFGVSRTAVREAVKALHEKGLIEVQPGKGTFISNITGESKFFEVIGSS